ncbi:hypothetical protein INT45_014030 [Circinella minor]|uniref:GB1/RHD3-type G domain-containing protein n=1 Tax=Circinella minor TaxID=1195481 RepID=A0A8H7VFR4_9FUNG|nr:hypothetical protein INT45_014030 [Circinella minor]
MDWPRFKRALTDQHNNDNQKRFRILVQESPFILEFLNDFYNALCRCQTPDQCSALYPQAESILTKASIHPFLATHPEIAKRLVACLLEYTKFEHSNREQSLQKQAPPIQWCITRLRRLIHTSIADSNEVDLNVKRDNDQYIQQQIERLIEELDVRSIADTLHSEKVGKLLDMSLILIHQEKAKQLIQKLVACAIELLEKEFTFIYWGVKYSPPTATTTTALTDESEKYNEQEYNSDEEELIQQIKTINKPISQLFLDTLLQHRQDDNRGKSQLCLWRFYDKILEAEIVDTIDTIALQPKYISSDDIRSRLSNSTLIQTMMINVGHFRKVYTIISEQLLSIGDWRVFRLLYYVFDSHLPLQLASAVKIIADSNKQQSYVQLHKALELYIYAGDIDEMKNRRYHAWLLPLMYPRFIYNCMLVILEWCSNKFEQWNARIDAAWKMVGWMVCPSDDDRLDSCLGRIREWILALKGFCDNDPESVIQLFSLEWYDVFNGNIVIALVTTLSILSLLSHWQNKDYISLLDATLHYDSLSQQPTTIVSDNELSSSTTLPYNTSIVYLFNDYLPVWESLLNLTMTFDDEYSLLNDNSLSNKLRHITNHRSWELEEAKLDYHVVSIFGPQGTGKSTLLNKLLGTSFDVTDTSQTTKGIWMSRAKDLPILVMDVEATDSVESGQNPGFERRATLFALATSEVIIFNLFENQVSLSASSNMSILKTIFQASIELFQNQKRKQQRNTLIIIAIRDYNDHVSFEKLKEVLYSNIKEIWKGLNKSDGLENCTIHEFFDFMVMGLSHANHFPKKFDKEVTSVQHWFTNMTHRCYVFQSKYHKGIPVDGYCNYTVDIWNQICANKKVDLPARQELLAEFHCNKISNT